jgi:hypothetical protein
MKHLKGKIAIGLAGLLLVQGSMVFADDSFGSFFDSIDSTESSASMPQLTIDGYAQLTTRAYTSDDSTDCWATMVDPSLRLDLSYAGANSELSGKLDFSEDTSDILEELTYRAFVGDFVFSAGKSKIVWGRGDNLHVLDLINANDYSDFIIPDYLDRRIAEPMVDVTWNMSDQMTLEAVWTPGMTADEIPTSGIWAPEEATTLTDLATSYVTYAASQAYSAAYDQYIAYGESTAQFAAIAAAEAVEAQYSDSSDFLPDTDTLEYSQYGLRLTGTYGPVDYGAEYYLGHYKTPSVSYTTNGSYVTDLDLDYDRLQVFGIDGAAVAGRFNLRGEAAYYLTDDIDGTDDSVHNNSLQWLTGFDTDLPFNEMNLNMQVLGCYILHDDEISYGDVDYNSAEKYYTHKLVTQVSDSYDHGKVKPSVSVVWNIEREDLIVMPKFEYNVQDDFTVTATAALFSSSDDGEFAAYEDNDFLQVKTEYRF